MQVDISLNHDQLNDLHRLIKNEKHFHRAAASALNKTADKGATSIRRAIAHYLGVKVTSLGSNSGKHPRGMVKPIHCKDDLRAGVRLLNYNIKLINTKLTPVKGQPYPIRHSGSAVPLTETPFQQTMPISGHRGWFVRYGPKQRVYYQKPHGKRKSRLTQPIKEMYAPSPRRVWEIVPSLAERELANLKPVLQKNLDSQIVRFLNRKR